MATLTARTAFNRYSKAMTAWSAARDAVYECGPDRNTRFSECFKAAPQAVQAQYATALAEREKIEREGQSAGLWFEAHGLMWWVQKQGRIGTVLD